MPLTHHDHFYEVVLSNRSCHSPLDAHMLTDIDIQDVLLRYRASLSYVFLLFVVIPFDSKSISLMPIPLHDHFHVASTFSYHVVQTSRVIYFQ